MKKLAWVAMLPLVALAAARDDYASQWPLVLQDADGGAYRVVLDREVYAQLRSPRVRDLVVVNAQGTPVATALFPADAPLAQAGAGVTVPWFPLPVAGGGSARDIPAISEIASVLRLIEDGILVITGRSLRPKPSRSGARQRNPDESLRDVTMSDYLREGPLEALRFTWSDPAAFDRGYRVSTSDDLRRWREVDADARLVQLLNNGQRIVEDRIALPAVQARYVRLLPRPAQSAGRAAPSTAPRQPQPDEPAAGCPGRCRRTRGAPG